MATPAGQVTLGAFFLVVVVLLGCGSASEGNLRTRAAFDLNCSEERIQIVELDGRTRGVSGCGQKVTYIESCDQVGNTLIEDCTWVLNSDSRPTKPPR